MRTGIIAAAILVGSFVSTGPVVAGPPPLGQGWSDAERQAFYSTSQGSQIMPYVWFMALERGDSTTLFSKDLDRFGYIPNPDAKDGLPIGFVLDEDPGGRWSGFWIGMTCAACHTSQLTYGGTVYRIDGGGARSDFFGFIAAIGDALDATANDDAKFARFAARIKTDTPTQAKLKTFAAEWRDYVKGSTANVAWGPARLDAFNMIFNRVAGIDLGIPGNIKPPDAPVSYPALWNAHWHDYVQWDSSAKNGDPIVRLGRNVGEVMGVFAHAAVKKVPGWGAIWHSTARRKDQLVIEGVLLAKLRSPQWPSEFGVIDPASDAYKRGRELYNATCEHCHAVVTRATENTRLTVNKTRLSVVKTDPVMATNNRARRVKTGILEGAPWRPGLSQANRLGAEACALDVVVNAVIGSILEVRLHSVFQLSVPLGIALDADTEELVRSFDQNLRNAIDPAAIAARTKLVYGLINARKVGAPTCYALGDLPAELRDEPGYKARPLNGIWATAPYLHNGSVPTLDDLLKPASQRPAKFYVGSLDYDPAKVGYRSDAGPFLFDTGIAGNRNTGHEYGPPLSDADRAALLLYLKSL